MTTRATGQKIPGSQTNNNEKRDFSSHSQPFAAAETSSSRTPGTSSTQGHRDSKEEEYFNMSNDPSNKKQKMSDPSDIGTRIELFTGQEDVANAVAAVATPARHNKSPIPAEENDRKQTSPAKSDFSEDIDLLELSKSLDKKRKTTTAAYASANTAEQNEESDEDTHHSNRLHSLQTRTVVLTDPDGKEYIMTADGKIVPNTKPPARKLPPLYQGISMPRPPPFTPQSRTGGGWFQWVPNTFDQQVVPPAVGVHQTVFAQPNPTRTTIELPSKATPAKEALEVMLQSLPTTTLRNETTTIAESLAQESMKIRAKELASIKIKMNDKVPRALRVKVKLQVPELLKDNNTAANNVV